jgi:2-polyprenyl-6-methoxyphenol hydroxylase-like FAD-dependent oxidoreductase
MNQFDVLIVGAGPVGLFLAHEMVRRQVRSSIIEQEPGQSEHSKALAVMPRTMEVFEMAGIVEPFRRTATPARFARIVAHQRELARIAFDPQNCDYPYVAMIRQNVTERLLAERLAAAGGAVEYETRLVGFEAAPDHVVATLEHGGEQRSVTARFLIGADGAHSTVRHGLELPFAGSEYDQSFVLADVELAGPLAGDEFHLCPSERGPLALFPVSANVWRIVATVPDELGTTSPDLELLRALLADRGPAGVEASRLIWSSGFRVHRRQTSQMRAGPVFLAGDAAHIHSPFGGQGMNTGLQDAWNLAWKLRLVLQGLGGNELLDSYSHERHAVARDVIAQTDFITRAMGTASAAAQFLRDHLLPLVTRLPAFQDRFVQTLSQLAVHYAGSPVVVGEGRRAVNVRLTLSDGGHPVRLYQLLDGRYLLLLVGGPEDETRRITTDLAARYGEAIDVRRVESLDGVVRVELLRPDGYLAFEEEIRQPAVAAALERAAARVVALLDGHLLGASGPTPDTAARSAPRSSALPPAASPSASASAPHHPR